MPENMREKKNFLTNFVLPAPEKFSKRRVILRDLNGHLG